MSTFKKGFSRRTFLKGSAGAVAAGLAATSGSQFLTQGIVCPQRRARSRPARAGSAAVSSRSHAQCAATVHRSHRTRSSA
ncbi:MAG: twin-arginine translocation signal domain-containing protein [Burkholderiales bacterium]|nr:twin-arginine translocation signal domain-containing protein [Anaerolineae bacterium]